MSFVEWEATFENINREGWYRVYLNELGSESYNSFDLKIFGEVELPELLEIFTGAVRKYPPYADLLTHMSPASDHTT